MNISQPEFGKADRSHVIHELAYTGLMLARDLRNGPLILICKRVIAQLRMGQTPKEGDIRLIHRMCRGAFK